jgi:hypothetical protein
MDQQYGGRMKTRNFPERKNQRRRRALERLETRWGGHTVISLPEAVVTELNALYQRVQPTARSERTKKDRG